MDMPLYLAGNNSCAFVMYEKCQHQHFMASSFFDGMNKTESVAGMKLLTAAIFPSL